MKKKLFPLLCLLLCAVLTLPARAARSVHMGLSDASGVVGDDICVILMCTEEGSEAAASIGSVELTVEFNTSVLKFDRAIGGMGALTGRTENGVLLLSDRAPNGTGMFLCELHFTALAHGSSDLTIARCVLSDGTMDPPVCTLGRASVTVNRRTEQDTTLYALNLSWGGMQPAFSPEITEYSLTVPYEVAALAVSARPNNYWATAVVDGHAALKVGENTVTVTVTSGDMTERQTYTIHVTREGPVQTPAPTAAPIPTAQPEPDIDVTEAAQPAVAESASGDGTLIPEAELPPEQPEPTPEPEPVITPEELDAARTAAYAEGYAAGSAEYENALAEAGTARERADTMKRAAKLSTGAAMVELIVIVALCIVLLRRMDGEDDND